MINAFVLSSLRRLKPLIPNPSVSPKSWFVQQKKKKHIFCSPGNHRPRKQPNKNGHHLKPPSPQCTRPGSSPPSSAPYPGWQPGSWSRGQVVGRWGFLNHQQYGCPKMMGLEIFWDMAIFGIYSWLFFFFWGGVVFFWIFFWNKSKKTNRNKWNNYSALSFETRSKRGKGAAKSSISMRPAGPQTRSRQ